MLATSLAHSCRAAVQLEPAVAYCGAAGGRATGQGGCCCAGMGEVRAKQHCRYVSGNGEKKPPEGGFRRN